MYWTSSVLYVEAVVTGLFTFMLERAHAYLFTFVINNDFKLDELS